MRVHELARELQVQSKDILAALEEMGLGGRTASSSVPDEAIPRLRASGGKPVPGAKPKAQAVEPLPERRPPPPPGWSIKMEVRDKTSWRLRIP